MAALKNDRCSIDPELAGQMEATLKVDPISSPSVFVVPVRVDQLQVAGLRLSSNDFRNDLSCDGRERDAEHHERRGDEMHISREMEAAGGAKLDVRIELRELIPVD